MKKNITITIDGKTIETQEGLNLLQVARENGIEIPGLCYHKKLSPTGACRLCVVKVEGERGLVMSCTLTTKDGMKVTAFDDETESNRKHTLEYLLSEHNEEFDDSYEDELRPLLVQYNLDKKENRTIKPIWENIPQVIDDSSPVLTYDSSKCIKCFRCIKACQEVQGKGVLDFADRGISKYIVAGYGEWKESECDGCGECIQLCPTGAIVEKPFRGEFKLKDIDKKVITTCPYCGVGCQTEVMVKDDKIVRIDGFEGVSPNDGRLCVKGRFGYQYANHKKRLTHPLIKRNGKFEKASWDEALDLIATKFNEIKEKYGKLSLAGYSSAKCSNEENYIFQKFIRVAFGNNNIDYCTRLCHASTVTAMLQQFGDGAGSNSIEDFETTDCLFVIGNNIIETHPITATYVKRGKAKGNKIIVVDPRWTPLVKYADIWLQPRLATDVAMLNGLVHIIIKNGWIDEDFIKNRVEDGLKAFDTLKDLTDKYTPEYTEKITGIPAEKLHAAAEMYATAPTAMIATGMGMSQQTVGTNNVFSLINMCLVTGQIGRERAGLNPPRGQNNVQGATYVGASPVNYPGYIPIANDENRKKVAKIWNVAYEDLDANKGLTTIEIMDAAYDEKVKGLYIMGENPIITDPNQNHTIEALEKLDFLVVQDIFETETSYYADVILPARSLFEKDGSVVNSDRRVLRLRKAISEPGEARLDWKITIDIAKRMGFDLGNYNNEEDIWNEIREVAPIFGGITYERIDHEGVQWPCYTLEDPGARTLFLEKFNTPSGKAKIIPVDYQAQSETASEEYPIIMNSGRMLYQYHSSTLSRKSDILNAYANQSYVIMNPNDAKRLGISDGDEVLVVSPRGSLKTHAMVREEVLTGEAFMPWHFHESPVNALTRSEMDPKSKIAPFKYSAVRIEKA
ncbi:MAG: formate dehydrogenase subunit alpha [Marinilabiliales bacterium]|nr:MAG: formate dehydrogenase subunit alpha [Marinilabiliales bacterium]